MNVKASIKQKNLRIQAIRGLLALAVILIHAHPLDNVETKIFYRPFVNIAVAGFVFLSGYLTTLNIRGAELCKRFVNVLIPYVVFIFLYTLVSGEQSIGQTLVRFAQNLLTSEANMALYFLVLYMQLVVLTPLLLKAIKRKSRFLDITIMAVQPIFMLCIYLGVISGKIQSEEPWQIMFFPMWILYYYLGLLLRNRAGKVKMSSLMLLLAVAVGIMLQIWEGIFWYHHSANRDMYYAQWRFTALLENVPLLLLIAKYIQRTPWKANRILCKLGDASFGIYLLHPFYILLVDCFVLRNDFNFLPVSAIVLLASYATVWALNKLVPTKYLRYLGLGI